jgi:hypothetical protein
MFSSYYVMMFSFCFQARGFSVSAASSQLVKVKLII